MSETHQKNKKLFRYSGRRGRPAIVLNYPRTGKFTVNTLVEMNPHVECRLSIYNSLAKLTTGKNKVIRYTGKTVKTGGVGKPLAEMQSMVAYRSNQNKKAARKAAKLPNVTVDLTPAPVPVTA